MGARIRVLPSKSTLWTQIYYGRETKELFYVETEDAARVVVSAGRIGSRIVHALWRKIHSLSLRLRLATANVHHRQSEATQVVQEVRGSQV
jgi:hypothetical protein